MTDRLQNKLTDSTNCFTTPYTDSLVRGLCRHRKAPDMGIWIGSCLHPLNFKRAIITLRTQAEWFARIENSFIPCLSPHFMAAFLNRCQPRMSSSCNCHNVDISIIVVSCSFTALASDQSMHEGVSDQNINDDEVGDILSSLVVPSCRQDNSEYMRVRVAPNLGTN